METSKFFIGAIVRPNEKSDRDYSLTNSRNIQYARVTSVQGNRISISILKYTCDGEKISPDWDGLSASCFDLVEGFFSFIVTSLPNDEGTEAILHSSNPNTTMEATYSSSVKTITDFQNMIYKVAQNLVESIKEKPSKEN